MMMGCYLRPLIGPRAILNSVKNHTQLSQLSDCTMANAMGNNLSLFYRELEISLNKKTEDTAVRPWLVSPLIRIGPSKIEPSKKSP